VGLSSDLWKRFEAGRKVGRVTSLVGMELTADTQPDGPPRRRLPNDVSVSTSALGTLNKEQRRIVVATVLQGRSLREVSREIGVSPMTVQRKLRTAPTSLAFKLGDLSGHGRGLSLLGGICAQPAALRAPIAPSRAASWCRRRAFRWSPESAQQGNGGSMSCRETEESLSSDFDDAGRDRGA